MKLTAKTGLLIAIAWFGSLVFVIHTIVPAANIRRQGPSSLRDLRQVSESSNRVMAQTGELRRLIEQLGDILESQVERNYTRDKHVERPPEKEAQHKPIQVSTTKRSVQCGEPSLEYENIRRKIDNGVTELWYYMSAQLKKIASDLDQEHKIRVEKLLENGRHQQRSILTDIFNLSKYDNYEEWREQESADLRNLVKRRFKYLQNPKNCTKAKKIYCDVKTDCGFGCQAHHVAYCMSIAYATGRTLVLESKGWKYSRNGWEAIFQPLSNTCTTTRGERRLRWTDPRTPIFQEAQVVEVPTGFLKPEADFFPMAIPEDLSDRLIRLHGNPFVWWMGQIMTFIMRPRKELSRKLYQAKQRLGFQSPIVGIHVRRTDKVGTEAAFHGIEDYMVHVGNYYQTLMRRQTVKVKRVYLATDDSHLLSEAKELYPDYVFISDNDISKSASVGSRNTEYALGGILIDISLLARCDFLVCTFSSNVCRVSYELMQDLHPDASSNFHSLDDIYYFDGMNAHNQVALYPHEAQSPDEISFQPGDLVGVAGNHWDGYSKGVNRMVGSQHGLYPSYKVENKIEIAKMPTYKGAESYDFQT